MIKTERLVLRAPLMSDLADIHAIFSDVEALTYWSFAPHRTLAETEAWLRPIIEDPIAAEFDLFIEYEGRLIGKLGCWKPPDFGFILNRDFWGRGLATEGLQAFIAYMRDRKATDHLFADVDPRNTRSKAALLRCGFHHVAFVRNTIETHIGLCDSDYYRLDL
jgi:RimJ/RimL family protein N-acetyltransferase